MILDKQVSFADSVNYFMDNIAENENIKAESEHFKLDDSQLYKQLIVNLVQRNFPKDVKLSQSMMIISKKYQFTHGWATLSNQTMVLFYFFDDIQVGMSTFSSFLSSNTEYYKLSAFISDKPIDSIKSENIFQ